MATIPASPSNAAYTINAAGTYTLNAGVTRTQTVGVGVSVASTVGPVGVEIEGTLNNTTSGQRAINFANNPIVGSITVGASGLVQSLNQDTIRSQSVSGRIDLTNLGQIISSVTAFTPSVGGPNPGTGFAITYNAALGAVNAPATDFVSGGLITNGSALNSAALIRSDNGDAIRLGSHQTLVNYGIINGNGQVNDAATNNTFNSTAPNGNGNPNTSIAQTYDVSRGVRINQDNATSNRIDNYGTITGAQHGVDVGVAGATNLVFNNYAGGQIIGRNGSGVGADTTGARVDTVTVDNSGLIRGAYNPLFDRAGYRTVDGDGDGVDIDGSATIINRAGAVIEGTGAGGYDSNGRLNNSEGLSLGGGIIDNSGAIRGAAFGIVVNNDSNSSGNRSGVAATQITNNAAGSINGQGGYAIRLENKTGTAADDDTIANYGSITGNGAVPSGTVLRQDGASDPSTVGTLDGRTYTTADAGSARFIRGDGSAIQTGEGQDTISNYGTITGNSGRAINLEGGADTLNDYTGSSVVGRIDGGAGTDTLNLRLDDRTGADAALGPNSGTTTGTLANVVNFEALSVQGGTWTVQDVQAYAAGVAINVGAGLTLGAHGALTGDISNAGTLAFDHSDTLTFANTITGTGALQQIGAGTVVLSGANAGFSGAVALDHGTLELVTLQSAGTGTITFATGAQTLRLDTAGTLTNSIIDFGLGDTIDLNAITFAGAQLRVAGSTVTVVERGVGGDINTLTLNAAPSGFQFTLVDDAGSAALQLQAIPTGGGGGGGTTPTQPTNPTTPTEPTQPTGPTADALIKFGNIFTDPATPTGQIYGLYEALLNRAPDPLGLENFTTALQNRASLTDVANAILNSTERGMGTGDATAFVQSLYQNLLNRPADASGLATFTNELANGVSPATVAVQLATSAEAQALLAPTFASGVFVPDASESSVARLYYGLLGRAPDAGGLAAFANFIETSSGGAAGEMARLGQVAETIILSNEFMTGRPNSTNEAFINGLYSGALGRAPDAGGQALYLDQLAHGVSRATVALEIAQSAEAQNHLVGVIQEGALLVA